MDIMPSVAEQLRQGREARHLSVQQVAEITKIRTDHLRALEEGNYDVFVAPVYIRGFVRSYSTLLKLEVPQVMATLDAELGQSRKFSESPPLTSGSRGVLDAVMLQLSKLDWRSTGILLAALALVLAVILGTVAWQHFRRADPLRDLKPGVYQPKGKASGETFPLPASPGKR